MQRVKCKGLLLLREINEKLLIEENLGFDLGEEEKIMRENEKKMFRELVEKSIVAIDVSSRI